MDLLIPQTSQSREPLYQQFYSYIKEEIRCARIPAAARMPSTRTLAEHLKVSRSTTQMAYDQLMSEGYIEAAPWKGYYVLSIENLVNVTEEPLPAPAGKADAGDARYAVDFSPRGIDLGSFPFSVWRKLSRSTLVDDKREIFSSGDPQGEAGLREAIRGYLHSARGVSCRPEQIVVGAGSEYLLMLLVQILGGPCAIAMENPTYKRAYRIFQSFAYRIFVVDMDENGMMVSGLEKENVSVAYVMPSHQFPTGTVMPIGRRAELLNWAAREPERYLIEDDYDSEFRYRGKPVPSLQASDDHDKVIYIGTFSKAIAPAIRVSYMVLPEALLKRYQRECWFYSCTVSRIDQRILNEFIQDGSFERHLNKMRKIYRGKHELLLEGLKPFQKHFQISGEHAGLHLLLTAKGQVSEEELIKRAAAKGVKVYGLSDSLVDSESRKYEKAAVLLGFGGLTDGQIAEGIKKLQEAWL